MRRYLTVFLAIVLCLALCATPLFSPAADAATVVKSGSCGAGLTWELDSDGKLAISGSGDMKDYLEFDEELMIEDHPDWYHSSAVKTVFIGSGATSVGDEAFTYLLSLRSVVIPASVTRIGSRAFASSANIKDVYFGGTQSAWNTMVSGVDTGIPSGAVIHYSYTAPTVTANPNPSQAALLGNTVTFRVSAKGSGLSYQWQYKTASSSEWKNWAGKTAASVTVTAGSSNNECQYRVVVTNAAGSKTSTAGKLFVVKPEGETIKKVGTCGRNVLWKWDSNDRLTIWGSGQMWEDYFDLGDSSNMPDWGPVYLESGGSESVKTVVITSGVTNISSWVFNWLDDLTAIAIPKSVTNIGSYVFSSGCALKDVYFGGTKAAWQTLLNNTEESSAAVLEKATIHYSCNAPSITAQPKDTSVVLGKATSFSVTASGSGLTYQWQYSKNNGATWLTWSGKTAATASGSATVNNSGWLYRCKVTNPAGSVFSQCAKLTVISVPTVSTQPKSITVASGKAATFKVVASGNGLSYQWQYKPASVASWKIWSGKTTASVTVTASSSNNGCQYRVVVKNAAGSVTSSAAKLTLSSVSKPVISTQPKNASAVLGKTATFQVAATGSGLTYQWQYSKNSGSTWLTWSGKTSSSVTVNATANNSGWLYRCIVKNAAGSVTSSSAKLTVK